LLREGKPLPPLPVPQPVGPAVPAGGDTKEPQSKAPPILGTPPPEPAGA